MVVSNLGKWSILTNIFQLGWNHQLDTILIYTAPNTLQPPGFSPNLLKRDNRPPKVRSGTLHLLKKMLAASPKKRPKAHKGCKVPEGGGEESSWLVGWLVGLIVLELRKCWILFNQLRRVKTFLNILAQMTRWHTAQSEKNLKKSPQGLASTISIQAFLDCLENPGGNPGSNWAYEFHPCFFFFRLGKLLSMLRVMSKWAAWITIFLTKWRVVRNKVGVVRTKR